MGGRGSAPDPAGGAYSAPPDPLADGDLGRGLAAPSPRTTLPRCRPFRPLLSPPPIFNPPNEYPSYGPGSADPDHAPFTEDFLPAGWYLLVNIPNLKFLGSLYEAMNGGAICRKWGG